VSTSSRPAAVVDNSRREGNLDVVERLWEIAFNQGNLDVLPELVHEKFENFGTTTNGPKFLADLITAQRTAFPDMHFTPVQVLADGDWVIRRARWTGTFLAPFAFVGLDGVEPTGRSFDVDHVHAFRLVDGKIAEHWAVRDDLTMHKQLLGQGS
jgi:predicted ester cyclase